MMLELEDIQSWVLRGYKERPYSVYLLLRVQEAAVDRATAMLRELSQHVGWSRFFARGIAAGSGEQVPVKTAIAFTFTGLETLGFHDADGSLVPEFRQGMHHEQRARVLGDSNTDAWAWGNHARSVDVLVAAFGPSWASVDGAGSLIPDKAALADSGLEEVARIHSVLTSHEPFGFRDGISNPTIDGNRLSPGRGIRAFDNRVAPGEFLFGYNDEFDKRPASPWVADAGGDAQCLPKLPRGRRDLGRNGSFLVARQLEQHVDAFHAWAEKEENVEAAIRLGAPRDNASAWLEARLLGRWHGGASLVTHPDRDPGPAGVENDFAYFDRDRHGVRCPLGAHVRRCNPRDALTDRVSGQSTADASQVVNHHRLLRRGRVYVAGPGSDAPEGLFFVCFNTNLERQFEFVQQTWVNGTKFGGLASERDPLSVVDPPLEMTLQSTTTSQRFALQRFVTVRGGAYFFLPGKRSLHYLLGKAEGAS